MCMVLVSSQEQSMREEIQLLRLRIAEQEEVLQGTIQRLRCTSRTKESMETFIVNQRESEQPVRCLSFSPVAETLKNRN